MEEVQVKKAGFKERVRMVGAERVFSSEDDGRE